MHRVAAEEFQGRGLFGVHVQTVDYHWSQDGPRNWPQPHGPVLQTYPQHDRQQTDLIQNQIHASRHRRSQSC